MGPSHYPVMPPTSDPSLPIKPSGSSRASPKIPARFTPVVGLSVPRDVLVVTDAECEKTMSVLVDNVETLVHFIDVDVNTQQVIITIVVIQRQRIT